MTEFQLRRLPDASSKISAGKICRPTRMASAFSLLKEMGADSFFQITHPTQIHPEIKRNKSHLFSSAQVLITKRAEATAQK
jgi:hypothetical protein